MKTDELLVTLIQQDILRERAGGTELALSEPFGEQITEYERQLQQNAVEDVITTVTTDQPKDADEQHIPGFISDPNGRYHPLVAEWLALVETVDGLSREEMIRLLPYLDQLYRGTPAREDVPSSFVPLQGDILRPVVQLFDRSIVYIYHPDSKQSALLKESFERIFETHPEDVQLFAVHGPDWREELSAAFDVTYTPVTLFILRGTVDVRLQGAQYDTAIKNETEKLRELSPR